ncbi:MAG: hypothetical protein NTV93_17750 [Verrucomicrobia bacterium]|nr:hypothetical protein [Verrucomicrobiota bacterium]
MPAPIFSPDARLALRGQIAREILRGMPGDALETVRRGNEMVICGYSEDRDDSFTYPLPKFANAVNVIAEAIEGDLETLLNFES